MTRLRRAIAAVLGVLLLRVWPEAAYFPPERDDERLTADGLAALLILHAEAIHDCQHTDLPRAELGMIGPRAKPA